MVPYFYIFFKEHTIRKASEIHFILIAPRVLEFQITCFCFQSGTNASEILHGSVFHFRLLYSVCMGRLLQFSVFNVSILPFNWFSKVANTILKDTLMA